MLNPGIPSFDSDPDLVDDAVYNDNLSISLGDFFAILDEEPPPSQNFSPIAQRSSLQRTPGADPIGSEKVFQLKEEDLDGLGPINDGTQHNGTRSFPFSTSGNFDVPIGAAQDGSSPLLQYEDFENGFFFDGDEGRNFGQIDGEISLQQGLKVSESDASNMSALCLLQNAGAESMRNMLTSQSGFSNAVNPGPIPSSLVHERYLCPSMARHPSIANDANLADTFHSEVDFGEATDILCIADGSCLTLNRESGTDNIEIGLDKFLPEQVPQPFVSPKREPMIHLKDDEWKNQLLSQNLCIRNEMQLHTQEGLIDTSFSGHPLSDFDSSSPGTLSYDRNHYEDIFFRSESSTDSSPLPSSRNSSSENVDRSLGDTKRQFISDSDVYLYGEKQLTSSKSERRDEMLSSYHMQHNVPKGSNTAQRNPARSCLSVDDDDDADLCILDDISDPAQPQPLSVHRKFYPVSHQSIYGDPYIPQLGGLRFKADDERLTFRLALQDLSQPKSEASPPEGVLTVPLLRHQRIALSWMVQKETNSFHCSGGILADDQGLGKTVSTIALILMERSSSARCSGMNQQSNYEALNLEDDDIAEVSEPSATKHPRLSCPVDMSCPVNREKPVMVVKSRPAAGTLVVCPTSVLRQWADELQNKVTGSANLSFLVYHGSNRTKDPYELAKYDVVLTTYAIVSMEVPKQPLVDKDDEEKGKHDAFGQPMGSISGKKRKKHLKDGNTMENALLDSATRPLGRVAWFRVILDEAQSIKNHRTQVARACWGLRAKRRWCLSGTPIQNAVDDLYSYFRFLRYDPYAVYKSFCSMIKVPISRNPTNGYKKLQAVLKTIMLRRTKGTLIDGKPIITLPPKTVTLKKVDFSAEERAFYSILEAESREQFKVYAAAGTVKQNYVNILLMLLRLRQACDHPLLVKGYDSNSVWRSSLEMASKLPKEKQEHLLSCLEACSAICTICNDAPEDAVVSICGHVFCNQCICEHLTGDDSICPAASCKIRLNVASVFSRGTLTSSLSGLIGDDCSHFSGKEMVRAEKLSGNSSSYDSCKVKAALEILRSLPRLDNSQSSNCIKDGITVPLQNTASTVSLGCSSETSNGKHVDLNRRSEGLVTEKAIVFSQWTRMLDMLEVPLRDSYIQYRRLDGTMSVAAREKAIKDFNTLPEVTVMIMSLKAASLGLNMVAACHVLLLDLWWNPTTEDQAIDRAHRIGQTRPVTVSRLTVKDTVEDRILALQDKKREMVASAFGEDESGSRQTRLTVEDLKYLFMV